jgi:nucleoside-diphosphate-sugar epimerase
MRVLITGAAGNLGGFLAQEMLKGDHKLRLMIHQRPLTYAINQSNVEVIKADLMQPTSLTEACREVDCIVHFAGVLFQPFPERFLPTTNITYVQNLLTAASQEKVGKFILVSFPHVEGESSPTAPATGLIDGQPSSIHAQTRLAAEKRVLKAGQATALQTVILRPGMIYGRGVLMIEAARRLMRWGLLPVWTRPTWIHLLALPDFNRAVIAAIEHPSLQGVVNLGDEYPLTLQHFLDLLARHWGFPKPLRLPSPMFYLAALLVELFASVFQTSAPITRDFIRIGMASYTADTSRMSADLLPQLQYPTIEQGLELLS